jgi:hypothetical protein
LRNIACFAPSVRTAIRDAGRSLPETGTIGHSPQRFSFLLAIVCCLLLEDYVVVTTSNGNEEQAQRRSQHLPPPVIFI